MIEIFQLIAIFFQVEMASPCPAKKGEAFDPQCYVETLSSEKYFGRGYLKNGRNKAAHFIKNEFKKAGLQTVDGYDFYQEFNHTVNVFKKAPQLLCDEKALVLGDDFIVNPSSGSGKFDTENIEFWSSDRIAALNKSKKFNQELFQQTALKKAIVIEKPKLTASVSDFAFPAPIIETTANCPSNNWHLEVKGELKKLTSKNVIAKVEGTSNSDSTLYITAHYDHLGGMGKKVFFPGANDNAAGTTMLIDLAYYFAKNPLKYDIIFIAFAGEEAGLIGSKYNSEHPFSDLDKIKFLFNLDLVGTGEEGATVVNATEYTDQFKLLTNINNEQHYLPKISARGSAANSDHFWYHQKGVPSFFLYTQGGPKAYHDVNDIAKNLPLSHYQAVKQLLIDFYKSL